MEVNNCLKKIKLLLDCMFDGKIVMNESYAEQLLRLFENDDENSPARILLGTPDFLHFIVESLEKLNKANIPLKVFLVKIATLLLRNGQFTKMQMEDFQTLSLKVCILDNFNSIPPTSLHLACIQLATELLKTNSGINLIIKHELWEKILYSKIHDKPKQISEAAYEFMAKLVWNLNDSDIEPALVKVLEHILKPIFTSGYLSIPLLDSEADTWLSDEIYTYVSALLAVLTEADNHTQATNKVKYLMCKYFLFEYRIYPLYKTCKNPNLLKLLNACLFRFGFLMFRFMLYNNKTDWFCINMVAFHRNVIMNSLNSRKPFALVDYVVQSIIIWSKFEKTHASEFNFPLRFERHGQEMEFSTQILIHLSVPIVRCFLSHRITNQIPRPDTEEQFLMELGKNVTDYILSIGYTFISVLLEMDLTVRKKLTTHTLKDILRLKGHLSDFQAGLLFQVLYYLLEVFTIYDDAGGMVLNENIIDPDDLSMLSPLLNAITMLLKEYNIPWYTHVEIVNIQARLFNLLRQNFLTVKHIVQVLDLINICVKKFLSPSMSLLVDNESRKSSTLNDIGRVIKSYMQHEDWEVRDSALNILKNCTELSFIKYISFQKIITENSLIILAAKAGLTASELYSQCTALKCLAAATKIDSLWQEILEDNPDIYLQLVYLLRNHGEGMVRKEAANVLTGVYTNQKLTPIFQNTLYEIMLSAALDDLHWEVQLTALSFWKAVIHKLLTDRGMLDGKFPPVTFSKEKRKIVFLIKEEIQRQLTDIMDRLSSVGCLTVLLECMDEINNTAVMDQAHCIARYLLDILDKYNYKSEIHHAEMPVETSLVDLNDAFDKKMDLSYSSQDERNKVIESILSLDQSDLMINLHNNYYPEKEVDLRLRQRSLVQPNTFIENFRNNNYTIIINGKRSFHIECVSTLDELLDEMLDLEVIT